MGKVRRERQKRARRKSAETVPETGGQGGPKYRHPSKRDDRNLEAKAAIRWPERIEKEMAAIVDRQLSPATNSRSSHRDAARAAKIILDLREAELDRQDRRDRVLKEYNVQQQAVNVNVTQQVQSAGPVVLQIVEEVVDSPNAAALSDVPEAKEVPH